MCYRNYTYVRRPKTFKNTCTIQYNTYVSSVQVCPYLRKASMLGHFAFQQNLIPI